MKKWYLVILLVLGLVGYYGLAQAVIGPCADCHTMHASQSPWTDTGWSADVEGEPQSFLLGFAYGTSTSSACIACHSGSSSNPIKTLPGGSKVPVVFFTDSSPSGQGPGVTLAGGNFCWVSKDVGSQEDTKGHNVEGLADQDSVLGTYDPPGWDPDYTSGFTFGQVTGGNNSTWSQQLTCAGTYGCHGFHTDKGIGGSHHNNKGSVPATSYGVVPATGTDNCGGYYRFLANIEGGEAGDWEDAASSGSHNEYKGANVTSNRNVEDPSAPPSDQTTISYLCAECHGVFHSRISDQTTPATPFLRHPTDTLLPTSSEPASDEYSSYTSYSILAPVARTTIPDSPSSDVTPGTDIVMCLSCHRAHGSPEPDLLRWDYDGCVAGTNNANCGCFVCHTKKDAD